MQQKLSGTSTTSWGYANTLLLNRLRAITRRRLRTFARVLVPGPGSCLTKAANSRRSTNSRAPARTADSLPARIHRSIVAADMRYFSAASPVDQCCRRNSADWLVFQSTLRIRVLGLSGRIGASTATPAIVGQGQSLQNSDRAPGAGTASRND